MKKFYSLFFLFSATLQIVLAANIKTVLIFSKTTGYRHNSIAKGVETISELLKAQHILAIHTEDAQYFHADSIQKFDAVIFLNTTGDILDQNQKNNFQKFIQSGKGFVGIHAASDTEYNWPWYGALVGGYFTSHPAV